MTDAASATVRAHDPDAAACVTRGPGLPESVWAHANAPLLHVARPGSLGPGRRGEQWLEVTAVRG